MTKRSEDLPDFRAPPLNEVVLGVQFNLPTGYQQILAGDVWKLFKDKYPQVQDQPPLPPTFETFGRTAVTGQFQLIPAPLHTRFWFLQPDGDELIQFQQDRLLHNWRKVGDGENPYPRFESIAPRFRNELDSLQKYLTTLAPQTLDINQAEISYINQFKLGESTASDWLRFITHETSATEDFSVAFRETILDETRKAQGRLVCDVLSSTYPDGEKGIQITLTARGAPEGTDIDSALNFIAVGHAIIVRRFTSLTTDFAHQKWGRIK